LLRSKALYYFGKFQVSGDNSDLVRRLVGVVEGIPAAAPEQEQPRAGVLVVDGAHVQRGVPRRIPRVHVGAVGKKVFQVDNQPIPTHLEI